MYLLKDFVCVIFCQWDSLPFQGILENVSNHLKQKSKYRLSKSTCLSKLSLFYVQIYILTHKKIPSKKDHPKIPSVPYSPTKSVFFVPDPKKNLPSISTNHRWDSDRSFPLGSSVPDRKAVTPERRFGTCAPWRCMPNCSNRWCPRRRTVEAVDPFRGDRRVVRGLVFGGWVFVGLEKTHNVDKRVGLKNGRDNLSC